MALVEYRNALDLLKDRFSEVVDGLAEIESEYASRAIEVLTAALAEAVEHLQASGDEQTGVSVERTVVPVLSDAEHRVAMLAATGHSNREIGHKLWVTVSTVEQHLTRVYRKLGVNGRSDLSAVLSPYGCLRSER